MIHMKKGNEIINHTIIMQRVFDEEIWEIKGKYEINFPLKSQKSNWFTVLEWDCFDSLRDF
jgi:hypothetical protein